MDYWKIGKDNVIISFPLEKRLGVSKGTFENSLEGFTNFTEQAERVIKEAKKNKNVRNVNGKLFYYIDGADKIKKVSQLYLKMVDFSQWCQVILNHFINWWRVTVCYTRSS